MTKSKLLICSAIFSLLFIATPALAYDESYFKGKAIEKADFQEDELVVEPELVYSLPGSRELAGGSEADRVVTIIDPKFSITGITAVFKAPVYTIIDQTKTYELSSFKRRVGDILAAGGVDIAKEDMVNPSLTTSAPLPEKNNLIKITRVSVGEIEEFTSVPYQVKKIDDPDLNKGTEKIQTIGKNGRKKITYQVRRENGIEISKKMLKEEISDKPQDQVVRVGTKPLITVKCKFNDTVIAASTKYGVDPNSICTLMMKESNGNPLSVNPDGYFGLFQYDLGFWQTASKKAGYDGAEWKDSTAQIYTTAWCFSHGQRSRWP